jgi:hypothetical protein
LRAYGACCAGDCSPQQELSVVCLRFRLAVHLQLLTVVLPRLLGQSALKLRDLSLELSHFFAILSIFAFAGSVIVIT